MTEAFGPWCCVEWLRQGQRGQSGGGMAKIKEPSRDMALCMTHHIAVTSLWEILIMRTQGFHNGDYFLFRRTARRKNVLLEAPHNKVAQYGFHLMMKFHM